MAKPGAEPRRSPRRDLGHALESARTVTPVLRVNRLRCEYRRDPLGLDTVQPRLSWILESEERGQAQSAYQVLVAGSEENLLWDSGKVASNRSVGIEYGGEVLRSGSRCLWKARVWDGVGNPSPYGGPAVFEMGLLKGSDWKAMWLSTGEGPSQDFDPPTGDEYDDVRSALAPSPYARKTFQFNKPVRRARLYATARGLYEMYVNGTRVGNDVFAPGWTDYRKRIQYQTYDVTGLLTGGPNILGAILGHGWYAGFVGFVPNRRGAHYGARPQLLAQLNVEYEDGTQESIATDGSWRRSTGPILYSDFLIGESYDARVEMPGWAESGFDDSRWYEVGVEDLGDALLVAQPDEGVKVIEEVEAKTVTEPERGVHVFDLGQNMVGWLRPKVSGESGTEVTIRHAEALNPDGTIYTANLRFARAADHYVVEGGGEETYEPRFTFHGFRYVEVTGYPGEPLR